MAVPLGWSTVLEYGHMYPRDLPVVGVIERGSSIVEFRWVRLGAGNKQYQQVKWHRGATVREVPIWVGEDEGQDELVNKGDEPPKQTAIL
jgi:hypothetical protein